MIDVKNMENALVHLEDARKMLDLQLKNIQTEFAEKRAELDKQKEQLAEERRQFETQKAGILENLKQLQQQVKEEFSSEEMTPKEAPVAVEAEDIPNIKQETIAKEKSFMKEKTKPVSRAENETSFIEIDDEDPVQTAKSDKDNKKKTIESETPILGVAVPINDLATSLHQQPLKDLIKGMGINDRFLFTKELFEDNSRTFNEVIKKLNNLGNMPEATAYLARFSENWDMESDVVKQFMLLVHRRYL